MNDLPQAASPLDLVACQQATLFITHHGTALQQALLALRLQNGSTNAVHDALKRYQNADGGFAHGLEPDLRTEVSSVICTTEALQILSETLSCSEPSAAATDLVQGALSFLAQQAVDHSWELLGPACNDAPHAPWWFYQPKAPGFSANADSEILGYLLRFGEPKDRDRQRCDVLWTRAVDHVASRPLEMHELLCYLRLYQCPALSDAQRGHLHAPLIDQATRLVKQDPADWEEYSLRPVDVCTSPDDLLSAPFANSLGACFELMKVQQRSDGSWRPAWSWGENFADTWREVEPEISARVTLQTLTRFHAFGLLPEGACIL